MQLRSATAEAAGLLGVTETHIKFRHPVVRSAAVYAAPLADRRAAHAALARALAGPCDRRQTRLASGTSGGGAG